MNVSISEPMRHALDALYEGIPAPPEVYAALTPDERAEVASLARTASFVRLSLNQPVPTVETEAAALARAHEAMRRQTPASRQDEKPAPEGENWFTRLFRKPGAGT